MPVLIFPYIPLPLYPVHSRNNELKMRRGSVVKSQPPSVKKNDIKVSWMWQMLEYPVKRRRPKALSRWAFVKGDRLCREYAALEGG